MIKLWTINFDLISCYQYTGCNLLIVFLACKFGLIKKIISHNLIFLENWFKKYNKICAKYCYTNRKTF